MILRNQSFGLPALMYRRGVQAAGAEGWWKLREAALFAAGSLEEVLEEEASLGGLDLGALLDSVLREDLAAAPGAATPLLAARALWLSAKCGSLSEPSLVTPARPSARGRSMLSGTEPC